MGECVLIKPTLCLDHVRLQFKDTITTPNKTQSLKSENYFGISKYLDQRAYLNILHCKINAMSLEFFALI